jgi:hypothetical protein
MRLGPRAAKKHPYVIECVLRPATHLWIRCQPLQCRHNDVLIKSAMDPGQVSKAGGSETAHI